MRASINLFSVLNIMDHNSIACGAPAIEPRWSSQRKAWGRHRLSRRLLPFVQTFYQVEKRDLEHLTEYQEQSALLSRLTNSDREDRPYIKARDSHVHPRSGPPHKEMAREPFR